MRRAIRTGALALAISALAGCGSGDPPAGPQAAAEAGGDAPAAAPTAARGESTPAAAAAADPPATSAGGAGPEKTVIAYLKAGAEGDPRACRLFTERGLRRLLRELAPRDEAAALDACEALFEAVGQDGNKTIEVGGRELTKEQVEDVPLDVERRPGSRSALVSGPGARARLVLVGGRWLIDSVQETG